LLKIRKYKNEDFEAVRQIALSSFSLTAFHTDPKFANQQANEAVWKIWCKPALENGGRHCLIADCEGEAVGFLIYGGYRSLRLALDLRMASIILFAVKEGFRNSSLRVGTTLLTAFLSHLGRLGVKLVTVGTDANNASALHLYRKAGFQSVLQWSTYRTVCDKGPFLPPTDLTACASPPETDFPCQYIHPIAFLEDSHFTEGQKTVILQTYTKHANLRSANTMLECVMTGDGKGHILIENQSRLSAILSKPFYRINRICGSHDFKSCIESLPHFLASRDSSAYLEIYLADSDNTRRKMLLASGYKPIHTAHSLHLWL
jgi:ribosomal protein S18 acetylase RimI-like enzyme